MKSAVFEIKVDENLSLVIPHLSRATEIFHLIDGDREHLRTWLPWVDSVTTEEDTRQNLSDRIKGFENKKQASFFGMVNGNFVASVGFVSLSDGEGEIGYWLLSKYAGKGLMTSFVKVCIDYGFEELGLKTIVIKCAETNTKSAGIPKRLGFTLSDRDESTRLRNGIEHNTLVFLLKKSDWLNSH